MRSSPSLYLLTGICCYAFISHFSIGFQQPRNYLHISFGYAALFVSLLCLFHIQTIRSGTVDQFIFSLRWTLLFAIAGYGCIFWFVSEFTQRVPQPLTIGFFLILAVSGVANFIHPYTIQFDHIYALTRQQLPWGESVISAVGERNSWFLTLTLVLQASVIYLTYVLGRHYLAHRSRMNLGMLLALILLLILSTQAILARLSVIHFIPLGIYGFLGMTIVMSLFLRHELRQKSTLANYVYEASTEGMLVTDQHNKIISVNPAFTKTTGYTSDEIVGCKPNILKSDRHDQYFYQVMSEEIKITGEWQGEIWNKRKNGEIYPQWLSINTITNHDGTVNRRVALFRDITKEKNSEELIWKQANFDELTGLLNRRSLHERLDHEIKKSRRISMPLAILLIDLDRFKEVNDTLGHDMGDALLKEAAQRMKGCIRNTDALGRLGGDEFVIVMGELDDVASVGRIAKNLLEKLSASYRLRDDTVFASASIGITVYPDDATDVRSLIKNADQAMYAAKSQGRNCFQYYTPAMQEAADKRGRLSRDLHVALLEKQFMVFYQPIVELRTGTTLKAEALIRWLHPELGLVSPADFIPIAEDTGLIIEIGEWVFHQAVDEIRRLRNAGRQEFQISINKSPLQFKNNADDHTEWFNYLENAGLSGRNIVVEITEGLLMEAKEEISTQLLSFRDHGMQVALDDFGTGYSSLAYLKKFDIDYIKIDQAFVRNLTPDSEDIALCEAMIVMAHKLGLQVVAEGVETEQQRDLLRQMHCDYGQGYLFSKPLPREKFEAFVREANADS